MEDYENNDMNVSNLSESDSSEDDEDRKSRKRLGVKSKKNERIKKNKLKFLDYFDSFRLRREHLSSTDDKINNLDFTIETYNDTNEKIEKIISPNFYESFKEMEANNISQEKLFELINTFIKTNSNILLYGYGSKLRLVYDFLNYFQDDQLENYHIMIFNCFNHEINIKYVLSEIQNYVITKFIPDAKDDKILNNFKTSEDQISYLRVLIEKLKKSGYITKFILVMNNIDGPSFINKSAQKILSLLVYTCNLYLLATCDNLYVNYYWSQTVKDNFSFYYLKYNTFIDYDIEVSNKNSLVGDKNVKTGMGLSQILKCLTDSQRKMIKKMAEIQIENDNKHMAFDKLLDIMIGEMLVSNGDNFRTLMTEPRDHDIIFLKDINGKEMYKLNLEIEVMRKLIAGEYDE